MNKGLALTLEKREVSNLLLVHVKHIIEKSAGSKPEFSIDMGFGSY